MSVKRGLFVTHRWAGIVLCLFFAMWFSTGVVMMYVPFPGLSPAERFAGLQPLHAAQIKVGIETAYAASGLSAAPARIRMTNALGRPAYHFQPQDGSWVSVFADNGERLETVTPAQAQQAAERFRGGSRPAHLARNDIDQWTVSGSLSPFRPLHRVALHDAAGTELYIADRTGEVVRDTTEHERFWNWLGANLHWIYPFQLVRHRALWTDIVVWLSIAGTVLAITGITVGLLRWRVTRRYRNGRRSPYQGWARWHHIAGLVAGVFVLTWIFSGLMSMNPWKLFPSKSPPVDALMRYYGGDLNAKAFSRNLGDTLREHASVVKEIVWVRFAGRPYYVFYGTTGGSLLYAADVPGQGNARFAASELVNRSQSLMPDARMVQTEWLTQYDEYWYSREHRETSRTLPVLRVRFDDPAATWYHIDPQTGQVVERLMRANRLQRWLYNGMHSLDFGFLLRHRPAWDIVMIVLALMGFFLSVSGIVLGIRRLFRKGT
ncbi:MAG: PepSY domain-containing protein [Gammaproteobacteria bacterium]|nr:PepSY domain-containing protein [Gammaproteobacteria bacterium]